MALRFHDSVWLWGVPALLALGLWLGWMTRRTSRSWKQVCLFLPLLGILLGLLGLAQPIWHDAPAAREVVVLLDCSASARTSPWHHPGWVQHALAEQLPEGTIVTIVGFAEAPRVLAGPLQVGSRHLWPLEWPPLEGTTGDLAAAVRWRNGEEAAGRVPLAPRWLFTDGLQRLEPLRTLQQQTEVAVTLLPPTEADVGIAELHLRPPPLPPPSSPLPPSSPFPSSSSVPSSSALPSSPPTGIRADDQGYELWVRVQATGKAAADIELSRDGQVIAGQRLDFPNAGSQLVRMADRSPREGSRYVVRLRAQDPWPEDDAASVSAPPRHRLRLLIASRQPAAWRTEFDHSTEADIVPPEQLTAARLADVSTQVVVLDDIATEWLAPGVDGALDAFVRQSGGGLVLLGRQHAFGPGHYPATLLEALSPLASMPPAREPFHAVFLLDASGSMGEIIAGGERKFTRAAQAVREAIPLLRPEDRVSVLTFSGEAKQMVTGRREDVQPTLDRALAGVAPDGPTHPDSVLGWLAGRVDAQTLVVLLTDGEIPAMDAARWGALIGGAKAKLTLVAPRQTGRALAAVAEATGASWLQTDDARRWAGLLREAVEQQLAGRPQQGTLPWRTTREAPTGAQGRARRWIDVWKKADGSLWAESAEGARALAGVAQRGLGRVGAMAWEDEGDAAAGIWEDIVGFVAPAAGDRRFTVEAQREAGRWRIWVEGHEGNRFLNGLEVALHLQPADGRAGQTVAMAQEGPGQYAITLPEGIGDFAGTVVFQETGQWRLAGRLAPPALPAPEYPATGHQHEAPAGVRVLAASRLGGQEGWSPRLRDRTREWQSGAWLAGVGVMLAALALRQGTRRMGVAGRGSSFIH